MKVFVFNVSTFSNIERNYEGLYFVYFNLIVILNNFRGTISSTKAPAVSSRLMLRPEGKKLLREAD